MRVSTRASTSGSVCDPKQGGDIVPAETIASKGPARPAEFYYFGGPLGVACIMMFAPVALVLLNLVCMKVSSQINLSMLQIFILSTNSHNKVEV